VAVFGRGIHPEESSICKSAIVDSSMPILGGVVGVAITFGLSGYEGSENTI
jgi:hypothetical protein